MLIICYLATILLSNNWTVYFNSMSYVNKDLRERGHIKLSLFKLNIIASSEFCWNALN